MAPTSKVTRRDRKAAETGEPKKPKLTQEEQDELEEKQLEEVCEMCGIRISQHTDEQLDACLSQEMDDHTDAGQLATRTPMPFGGTAPSAVIDRA